MTQVAKTLTGWGALTVLAIASIGCGGDTPPTGNVTGTVTYNGSPVANANVTFQPNGGRPATGVTDASGKYTLATFGTSDGAVLGSHKISITPNITDVPMPETPDQASAEPKPPFPKKYMNPDTSGLTADVKSGPNEVNLELKD